MSFATTRPTALAAAGPTAGVVPAAADQVSAIHELFVNTLGTSSVSYLVTEVANAAAAG